MNLVTLKGMIADLKTTCVDRMDSITANGVEIGDLFEEIEDMINDQMKKEQPTKKEK